jgi:hypothetical protein
MCTQQSMASKLNCWIEDPMIRLVMDSDGVSDREMLDLLRRVSAAVAARSHAPVLAERF